MSACSSISPDYKEPPVFDLRILYGAGGENRTHTLSLGSCGQLRLVWTLTWANGWGTASSGSVHFTVIPRCSLPDLVLLWCGSGASLSSASGPSDDDCSVAHGSPLFNVALRMGSPEIQQVPERWS